MRTTKLAALPLGAVLVLLASGCNPSGGSTPSDSMNMTVGYTAIGAAYSDLYVCEDKGVFAKNGLHVKLTLLNSSSQLVAALESNSVQVGAGTARTTASGIMKGLDLRYVALPIPKYYMEMWGKPSISSPAAIRGLRIGLSSPGSLGDAAVDAMLKDKGWTAKDIRKTYLKSSPAEVTALDNGAVDAIVTQPPTGTQTRSKGFKKIMDFTGYPAAANAYTVKGDYLSKNKKAVAAFVRSEAECLSILHKDKAAAVASIEKHSGQTDPALAEYSYDFFEPLWARTPTTSPALIADAFAQAADGSDGKVPEDTAKYVDNSFVQDLTDNGFIPSLYKKK